MGTIIEACSNFASEKITRTNDMNGLPDEILETILSNLTLKEAARTSVLSRRWRFLWTYFKGKIDFVAEDLKRIDKYQLATTMNEILKLHRGKNVESLGIVFDFIHYSTEDFNYWIEFAAKKGVRMLQLILGSFDNYLISNWVCDTTPQFLKRFSLESLQVLSLRCINVNVEALECFLTSSPNLQRLDLIDSSCLSNIVIPSSSLSLKELQVIDCHDLKKIEISARNLEIFNYLGSDISIEVKEFLHRLHTVYYGYLYYGINQLRSFPFFQLEKLTLDTPLISYFHMDHFILPKLKCLNLVIFPIMDIEIVNSIHLLNAAPILHTFAVQYLHLGSRRRELVEFQSHGIRRHQCLKVLKIVNFARIPEVVRFIKSVIDKAESPEMLILVVSNNCSICPPSLQYGNTGQLLEHGFLPKGVELRVESVCQGICRVQRTANIFPRSTVFGRTFESGRVL